MKKLILILTVISTVFLFSCDVTALSTDIIEKESKTNELKYKINHINSDEENSEYQFRFEDIPLKYCKNITFDFNNFHKAEGLHSTNGEMGFFFNLVKRFEEDDEPQNKDKKCDFYLFTIKKYVNYEEAETPTIYEINIYKYININYPNLINKNIIGDANGFDINEIYCNTECTVSVEYSDTINIQDFESVNFNDIYKKLYINKSTDFFSEEVLNVFGIYSKINPEKKLNAVWHFKNK